MTAAAVALAAMLVGGEAAVDAVTVVPVTFEQLVDEALAIVYARVSDVRGQWTEDRRAITSLVTLEPLQYMKGHLGATLTMRLPGGEAGGVINVIPGAPVVRAGDLIVVFLASRGPSVPTPVGLGQGIFRVVRDASGVVQVTPPPLKASALGRVIRGAADRRALTLDAFAAAVRDAGSAR
jgi:hypothetical protein